MEDEIKEYHFHVYFFQNNPKSRDLAMQIRAEFYKFVQDHLYVVALDRVHEGPVGPHTVGSFEVWVPQEYFAPVMSWFILHRPETMSILCHPLTRHELLDHSVRALWLGPPLPLDLTQLDHDIGHLPAQFPMIKLGYSVDSSLSSVPRRTETIKPVSLAQDEHEEEDDEEFSMNGNGHINYVNNFNPPAAVAPELNENEEQQMIPTGVLNVEVIEETLRLLNGANGEIPFPQTALTLNSAFAVQADNAANEVSNNNTVTSNGEVKRKRGRPRKGTVGTDDQQKKPRKKRKKDDQNQLLNGSSPRLLPLDQSQVAVMSGQMLHPALRMQPPVPVVNVLHSTIITDPRVVLEQQRQAEAAAQQIAAEKGADWEVVGQGEIGTLVQQLAQVLEEANASQARVENGEESAYDARQEPDEQYTPNEYADLASTLNEQPRPQPIIETVQSSSIGHVPMHKPIESHLGGTLELELESNTNAMNTSDGSFDNEPPEVPRTLVQPIMEPLSRPTNTPEVLPTTDNDNIVREMQAVLSPMPTTPNPNTPLPHTPLPNTSLPHAPLPVTPLPHVNTPTEPQLPPRPQIDYVMHPVTITPPALPVQQPLEEGEIDEIQETQVPLPQPRTPSQPNSQPTHERPASQTLVLEDDSEELVLPSHLDESADSVTGREQPPAQTPAQPPMVLQDDAERSPEDNNQLTSPSSDEPRTPIAALLARTGAYYYDSDIEEEIEPIAVRRAKRSVNLPENRRRHRSPSPPSARKKQRAGSVTTPNNTKVVPNTNTNNNNSHSGEIGSPASTPNNTNAAGDVLNLSAEPAGQVDMTAEPPRRRGRPGRRSENRNVNRFQSVPGLIDLVDE